MSNSLSRVISVNPETLKVEYEDGGSIYTLSAKYGCSPFHMGEVLRRCGIVLRRSGTSPLAASIRDDVCYRYQSGESTNKIAAALGIGKTSAKRVLREAGIACRSLRESHERYQFDREEAIRRYLAGERPSKIAKDMGISPQVMDGTLTNWRVKRRTREEATAIRRYVVCDSAFANMAGDAVQRYWAGFLAADGCVSDNGNIYLSLQAGDHEHVVAFQSFLQTLAPVHVRLSHANGRSFPQSCIRVISRKIAADLASVGITPRKSYTMKCSEEMENDPSWWRGVVDGDGTVKIYEKTIVCNLCGSPFLMQQFNAFVKKVAPWFRGKVHGKGDGAYRVTTKGTVAVSLIRAMYGDPQSVALSRKMAVAQEIIRRTSPGGDLERFGNNASLCRSYAGITVEHLRDLYAQYGQWGMVARHLGIGAQHICKIRRRLGLLI